MEVAKRLVVGGLAAVCFLFICALIGPGKPEPQEEPVLTDYPVKRADADMNSSDMYILSVTDTRHP